MTIEQFILYLWIWIFGFGVGMNLVGAAKEGPCGFLLYL